MRASHAANAVRRERCGRYAHSYCSARRVRASLSRPRTPRSRPFLSYGITRRTAGCGSISGAAAGVVTTSTGPWRAASASSSGVVRTTSPRKAVWMTRLVNLQDRQERLLRDLDRPHLLHPFLSLLLLLEQLALARDVAAVALGGHVLAQRADGLAGDHFGPDRGLDHDLEQLARDQLLQLLGDLLAPLVRLVAVDDDRECVHGIAVEQHVELDELGRAVLEELVVERGVAAGDGLQLVVEVENDLGQREFPAELDARRVDVVHALVHAAPLLAQLHDGADVLGGRDDPRLDVRFLDVVHRRAVRHQARILDQLHGAVRPVDVVLHVGHGADQIEVELPLEPLPHDLHVQQAEEPAAEPETERHRRLRLVVQRSVVELELAQRVAQLLELLGVRRVQAGEHHRHDIAVPGQQRHVAVVRVEHRIAGAGVAHAAHVGHEVADFAGFELLGRLVPELQVPDLVHLVDVVPVRAEGDLHAGADRPVHDADAGDRPAVPIVIRVEDEGAERRVRHPTRRGGAAHHRLEQVGHVGAFLGGNAEDLFGLRPDELMQLPHQALVQRARELDEAVGQGGLPVVDMGYDAKVADVILAHVGLKYSHPSFVIRRAPSLRTADDGWRRTRYTPRGTPLAPITGWFDPTSNGGAVRLAANSYLPAKGDAGVRLPGLRRGDLVTVENGRVVSVNGVPPARLGERPDFAKLGAVHPSRLLRLETAQASSPRTAEIQRVVDLICPLGFGQRALIVSPPKAGKTVMLQAVAEGVALNHPAAILLILLVDERPEEVSEMVDWGRGEVIASSFDLSHERHVAVADMVFEHARRQVELGKDVVIVLDSLTRLARSHNTTGRGSGRTMSGGLDANALAKPKAMFGAARAVPQDGSLTVIATALIETESRMDDVIFEEFKGTGNSELRLSRTLADRRLYPAVDVAASGTRREELLADPATVAAKQQLRRGLVGLPPEKAMEGLLAQLRRHKTNAELLKT